MRRISHAAVLFALLAAAACDEEGLIRVRSLTFPGVMSVDEARLRDVLATKQSSKLPWGRKSFFDRARFDADVKRIQAFYADRGFPAARVTGVEVNLNQEQTAVDIVVTVVEGEPVRIAGFDFSGFDVVPAERLNRLRESVPIQVGQARDRQLVLTAQERALNELREQGYPYARVETQEVEGPDNTVTVNFVAEPGTLAFIGPIEIQGNRSVGARVIERELTFKTGDRYQRSALQESQRRLFGLELFQFANIEPVNPELQPMQVPVRITVAEGKHQRVNFGVGYGTEEKGRVDAEYHHVNFLGDARLAGVHGRWSSLDRGLRIDFNQPYLFSPDLSLGAEAQQWYTYTPAYQSRVTGGRLSVRYERTARTSWAASFTTERTSSSIAPDVLGDTELYDNLIAIGLDPTTGSQSGTLNGLGFDLQHSTADTLLNATRGYQLAFHVEQAGGFMPGTFDYSAVSADARQYLPVGAGVVLASRLQLGNIRPGDQLPENVPFSKKYFLGGATSIRGWGRYEVSPLSDSGLPLGGNSMFAFSEELRVPLGGRFGAVVFLDGGNVWANSWTIDLRELRYAVGTGLRYQTPVGPVRFDLGYQLNPTPELLVGGTPQQRPWRIHFSIGQAF